MLGLLDAVHDRDLERVQRLVADGADVKEREDFGFTPLLRAARFGHTPIMHWLLTEGGSSVAEQCANGYSALLLAAPGGHFSTMQWLLEEQGASIIKIDHFGRTVWDGLYLYCKYKNCVAAELSSLLKVMVMLDDAPAAFVAKLSPQHADICTRGRQLRAHLPSYLGQQRATVVAHCPLPSALVPLVIEYAATTREDMWAYRLRVQAPRAKKDRKEANKEKEEDGEDASVPSPAPKASLTTTTDCMMHLLV
jgi:hypothetical protein